MRTETTTLIDAMRILAQDIQSDDGVANAAIAEAADRLDELQAEVERVRIVNEIAIADLHNCKLALGKSEQERDQLKVALQRFMELDQNDRDLPLELWAVQHDVSPVDISLALRDAEVIEREAKPIATEFFRWWYNQPGSNTDQGFDEWWQLRQQAKEVQS